MSKALVHISRQSSRDANFPVRFGGLSGVPEAFLRETKHLLIWFYASFFPFCPLCWPPLFLPSSRHIFALLSPSKNALFCRAKGTVQSLERGSFRMPLSTKFGKEIPSRNLREKKSVCVRQICLDPRKIAKSVAERRQKHRQRLKSAFFKL